MARGFTLLELIITVAVLMAALAFVAPNFQQTNQQVKMQNIVTELQNFLLQAKSEAVLRNQTIWVHLQGLPTSTGQWTLTISTVSDAVNIIEDNTLAVFNGERYPNLNISGTTNTLKFEHILGITTTAASISVKKFATDADGLKIMVGNQAGRIRICGISEKLYDYPKC